MNEIEKDNITTDTEVIMSAEKAKELTRSIQSTTSALYILIKQAHDEKAWLAMGYDSWSDYIKNEFDFSRTRSYQLINQANVIEEITQASGVKLYITEREARAIKKKLPEITEKLEKDVKNNDLNPDEAEKAAREIIDGSQENNDNDLNPEKYNDGYPEEKEDNSEMEEWKPEGIDMDKMQRMLSDDDMLVFRNLLTTLQVFEALPNAIEFGNVLNKSSQQTDELLQKAENACTWLTQLIDEIE